MKQPILPVLLAALAAVSTVLPAGAQTSSPSATSTAPTGPSSAAASETVQMEKFNVNDVPTDEVILPTARPFSSVFGTDDNIVDVPRNVTIISREQMDTIGIEEVTDFSKLTDSRRISLSTG